MASCYSRREVDLDKSSITLVYLLLFILPLREVIPTIGPVSIGRVLGVVIVGMLAARLWTIGLRKPTVFHALFAAFLGWGALSLLWAPGAGRGVALLARIGFAFVATLLVWDVIETRKQLENALIVLLAGASIVALIVLGDFVWGGIDDRGTMTFGFNAAVISRRLVFCVPLAGYLYFRTNDDLVKGYVLAFVALSFFAMIFAVVRQGLVAMVLGAATFAALEGLRRRQSRGNKRDGLHVPRKVVADGGLISAGLIAVLVAVFQLLPADRTAHLTNISLSGRTDIWAAGLTEFVSSANPFLGLGIAAFNTVVGPASSIDFDAAVLWPHSSLVGVLVELGIVGLLLFFATAAAGFLAAGVRGKDWPLLASAASVWIPLTLIADVHLDATAWVMIALVLVASRISGMRQPMPYSVGS